MKFTVTPLGGAQRDLATVVAGIVRYLQPNRPPPPQITRGAEGGPSRYYADSGEEPGRWLGEGARRAGLVGGVHRADFASVLAGRDPHTGERLITAQGSAGRRPKLGVGAHSAVSTDGEQLYNDADAAAVLGVTHAEVSRMLDVGTCLALARFCPPASEDRPPGDQRPIPRQPAGSYLVPRVTPDGSRHVSEAELTRCLRARDNGTDPEEIDAAGQPDDQLPLAEAARLAGVTAQYLRRAAKYHEDNRVEIERRLDAGRRPRHAYLVAHRGTRNQWLVKRSDLADFLRRRKPPAVRVGFDLTLTTEKSLGVLALLGGPDVARSVLGAIQTGNDLAVRWLETEAAAARVGGKSVRAAGWTVASFRHLTSRALDPFPHHHNVIANTVTLEDGTRRALDARGLYRNAHEASALATAEMRRELSASLGVRWRRAPKGGWEIDGIDGSVLREFSRRRNEIDDALRELEDAIGRGAHPNEIEHVVLRTRPAKEHTAVSQLIAGWRQRAESLGFDQAAIDACHCNDVTLDEPDLDRFFASLAQPDGICAGGSVFTRAEALAALVNHPVPSAPGDTEDTAEQPLLCGASRLQEITDQFLASSLVVQVGTGDSPLYTTSEMLEVQDRIVTRFRAGLHRGGHRADATTLATALERHPHLSSEQRHLVTSWCTSGHRFQAAIGRAGAGKTTSVAAAAEAWQNAGYRVIGAAVKGEAARTLANATGIHCETVAWYLVHDDPASVLDDRTILVVDEASTVSDRDLDRLMWMTTATGAALRLVGDPAQHGAITAGGMFRVLCDRHGPDTPELVTTHRMQDPDDRAAAEALREGRIDDAFDHLQQAGHLHVVDNDLDMYRNVLGRWWDAHRQGLEHPMVDRRNSTRRKLNQLAHRIRQVNGEISSDEIVASSDRYFSVGDRVTARAPNRHLHVPGDRHAYVRNGALGTVVNIRQSKRRPDRDTITVDFDGIGIIALPRSFFDHHRSASGRSEVGIDHAYALTSYAVQGSTSAVSTSRVDSTTTRAETYVDITRGRDANHLYLSAATDPLDGEALPRLRPNPADDAVAERLVRSTGELTAWEIANQHPQQGTRAIAL